MNSTKQLFLFFTLLGLILVACKKEEIIKDTSAKLTFSADTVFFDTVLANTGSVTQRFKIYNPNDRPIVIQDLYLGSGSSSFYRLNVDGIEGNQQSDIKLEAKDSIYVFVEVTIDPDNNQNPFIIADSVMCITNGNVQNVKLVAYGQNVHLFRNEYIQTQTWSGDKPYLIQGTVELDSNEVLTIAPGTRIYLGSRSSLSIRGKLEAHGTYDSPILFTGARFDEFYESSAGQWGTIFFHPNSYGSTMEYVTVKNAMAGIQIGYPGYDHVPDLTLKNCMIINSQSIGIYAFNAKVTAYNTIVADAGASLMKLFMGGDYNFYQCSLSNISARVPKHIDTSGYAGRSDYSLEFSNYFRWYEYDKDYWLDTVTLKNEIDLNFYNSIIFGVKKEEIIYHEKSGADLNYAFHNCLITNDKNALDFGDSTHFDHIILNKDPGFKNDSVILAPLDFELDALSPAINAGKMKWIENIPELQNDYKGNDRSIDGKPDLGAYEREE